MKKILMKTEMSNLCVFLLVNGSVIYFFYLKEKGWKLHCW